MRISTEKPPCWDRLEKAFGVTWENGIIITYDGVVHTMSGELASDVAVHEAVHIEQQNQYDPDVWLDKYIDDADFRLKVELEAYRAQAKYLRETIKNRELLHQRIHWICRCLVNNYGFNLTYEEATKLI